MPFDNKDSVVLGPAVSRKTQNSTGNSVLLDSSRVLNDVLTTNVPRNKSDTKSVTFKQNIFMTHSLKYCFPFINKKKCSWATHFH